VLAAAEGKSDATIAVELGTTRPTVARWRRRFEHLRMQALLGQRSRTPHTQAPPQQRSGPPSMEAANTPVRPPTGPRRVAYLFQWLISLSAGPMALALLLIVLVAALHLYSEGRSGAPRDPGADDNYFHSSWIDLYVPNTVTVTGHSIEFGQSKAWNVQNDREALNNPRSAWVRLVMNVPPLQSLRVVLITTGRATAVESSVRYIPPPDAMSDAPPQFTVKQIASAPLYDRSDVGKGVKYLGHYNVVTVQSNVGTVAEAALDFDFTMAGDTLARDNARVLLHTPDVRNPIVCPASGFPSTTVDRKTVQALVSLALGEDSPCVASTVQTDVRVPLRGLDVRPDLIQPLPIKSAIDEPEWNVGYYPVALRASYVLTDVEARAQNVLFAAGVLAGIGGGLLPLVVQAGRISWEAARRRPRIRSRRAS
jgi:hypothetical protein